MDYARAISTPLPGSFVPDLASAARDETPNVSPLPGAPTADQSTAPVSFKDTVKQMLAQVNDKLQTSDGLSRDLADGKTNDLQQVVTSVEEANLALQFTMAMRTKLLEAYQEISRMQV